MGRVASVRGRARRLERLVDRSLKRNGVSTPATPVGGAARARRRRFASNLHVSRLSASSANAREYYTREPLRRSEKALR